MKKEVEIQNIYIVPLRTCPVFPGMFTTIEVTDPLDIKSIELSEKNGGFGLLLLKNTDRDSKHLTPDDFYSIGTFARTKNQISTIYGSKSIYIETLRKFKVIEMCISNGMITAKVQFIDDKPIPAEVAKGFKSIISRYLLARRDKSAILENAKFNAVNIPDALRLSDYLATMMIVPERQQEYLETLDPSERILKILQALDNDEKNREVQNEIQETVNKRVNVHQKEFFLREELKVVKEQLANLGLETDEDNNIIDLSKQDIQDSLKNPPKPKLIDRLKALNLQGEAYETVFSEYSKLQKLEPVNPEYSICKSYLETVADLPWNTVSEENYSIEDAKAILEKDHYGIKDVKERILEFIAVRKLKNDTKGSIICLIGPPGTGKTSVGISIAKALNKQYYRFSVGGMRDESEIKGHRRTYIGAMPGQIIKGLKVTKTKNPVFVIDEIDKMMASNQGDPAAALLEVLDPEQNTTFRDHYLDIPFDVSNVLFIVTANTRDSIPTPLLDRMECIELNGYTSEEKLHIGKKYLVPKSRKKHGIKSKDLKFSDPILRKIAEEYARESGVRNFEKALDKINRKVAMEIVSGTAQTPVVIDDEKLVKYLGQPIFREDEILKADKPGMSIGLAWTSMGGDVLAIEAQHIPGKGELKLTGQLGDVMKESATIAFSYIKSIAESHGISTTWFTKNSIHLHVPEGATPKDGPSAGITMATAMYSLVTNQVMAPNMAMTGELSLLGKVMPIGGLKEKVLAAKRNKIKTIIIPKHNQRDLDKLEDNVKKGITFYPVSDMEEVLNIAFLQEKMKNN